MIYKMTLQRRGKSGWYSHPKTLTTHIDKEYIISVMNQKEMKEGEKLSVWSFEASTGEWTRIASREVADDKH